jgi:geranylgeranyl diphosphate synthase type II
MSSAAAADLATALLARAARAADAALERWLPPAASPPTRLHEAMRYSVFAGGKRLRPALVLAWAEACCAERAALPDAPLSPGGRAEGRSGGADDPQTGAALAAVELLHTYTLVHDDLPAMDDDDLRRGRPTCHKAFDEATAILAGDALQTLAFAATADLGADAVRVLASAAGSLGVIGGQQEDLDAEGQPIDAGDACRGRLERIHRGKTAALIRASCELGVIAGGGGAALREAARTYGEAVGLAFQIADDVLDATASAAQLGKTPGKDAAQGKLTYVAVYGLERARAEARRRLDEALATLAPLGGGFAELASLARFIVERSH